MSLISVGEVTTSRTRQYDKLYGKCNVPGLEVKKETSSPEVWLSDFSDKVNHAQCGRSQQDGQSNIQEVNEGAMKASTQHANTKPVLLSGGNPQIAKADGDAPVQAYIAAMPGWKSDVGRRLDELIVRTVPDVRKAVRWNSPWYGLEGQGWFVSYHVFTRYVKVTFLNGASLRPVPPGSGKDKDSRWVDVYEGELDEKQMKEWVRQAAALPGWCGF